MDFGELVSTETTNNPGGGVVVGLRNCLKEGVVLVLVVPMAAVVVEQLGVVLVLVMRVVVRMRF